jgi:hypothetical protein
VALATALLLGGLIAVILMASSSGSDQATAPQACLRAWNSNRASLTFGRHNSLAHGYTDVQVGYMPEQGGRSIGPDPDDGSCAIVFAADQLDPEPFAVGEILTENGWVPLSELLAPANLTALQSAALAAANATVTAEGRLVAK